MYKNTCCKLQAHRGVSTDCPENTMAAFREAVSQGYDVIEFDPKFTRDGEIVVLHDWSLNRTGRIAGEKFTEEVKITDVDFSFLADVDVGEWFDGRTRLYEIRRGRGKNRQRSSVVSARNAAKNLRYRRKTRT